MGEIIASFAVIALIFLIFYFFIQLLLKSAQAAGVFLRKSLKIEEKNPNFQKTPRFQRTIVKGEELALVVPGITFLILFFLFDVNTTIKLGGHILYFFNVCIITAYLWVVAKEVWADDEVKRKRFEILLSALTGVIYIPLMAALLLFAIYNTHKHLRAKQKSNDLIAVSLHEMSLISLGICLLLSTVACIYFQTPAAMP